MSLVFWDSNLFIYFFEGVGNEAVLTKALRDRIRQRGDQICTSTISLGEILVKPIECGDIARARRYEQFMRSQVRLIGFDVSAALRFAEIRAGGALKPPDAMQLACAGHAGVDLFVTNDDHLSHKRVRDVRFIASLPRAHAFLV